MSVHAGIRSRKDLCFFLFLVIMTLVTVGCMFLPLLLPFNIPQTVLVNLSPITYLVTIAMTIIGIVWASYGVLGLIVEPAVLKSCTFNGQFSILIAAKDEEQVVGNLLSDLKRQTYRNFEAIVVCHNCVDDTLGEVQRMRDNRFVPVELTGKPGKSAALNYGAQYVKGEVVAVFDADNRVPQDFLEKARHYFPENDAVQSRIEAANPRFNLLTELAELEFISFTDLFQRTRSALHMNCALGGTGEVIKTDVLRSVGWWDEWSLTEDFALFTKLTRDGYRIGWAYDTYVMDEKIPWWTEFFRQRARWIRGHYQVAAKYMRDFIRKPADLHYLIAPISILGYYFTFGLWLLFFLGLPVITDFLPVWVWLVPWLVWNVSIATRIVRRKGVRSLALFPLLFFYLYHWIAIFPYIFKTRTWAKTPHGFSQKKL